MFPLSFVVDLVTWFLSPFVVVVVESFLQLCVQKGKKTTRKEDAFHHQLACGNPTQKSFDILVQE
jgi:hypothetical protein